MRWFHANNFFNSKPVEPKPLPMHLIDAEMAECMKRLSRSVIVKTSRDETVKEALATMSQYLIHRSMGDDDSARHALTYVTMLCDAEVGGRTR